jgi:hypothetical protein
LINKGLSCVSKESVLGKRKKPDFLMGFTKVIHRYFHKIAAESVEGWACGNKREERKTMQNGKSPARGALAV